MSPAPSTAHGEVLGLFLLQEHGKAPRSVPEATALFDQGLAGDLHSGGSPGRGRQVLLAAIDDLARLNLKPGDLREQVTVSLPGLMALSPGAKLEAGDAVLEITGPCQGCTRIGALLGRENPEAFRQALVGRRGMLARVAQVRGAGRIRVGDRVTLIPLATRYAEGQG